MHSSKAMSRQRESEDEFDMFCRQAYSAESTSLPNTPRLLQGKDSCSATSRSTRSMSVGQAQPRLASLVIQDGSGTEMFIRVGNSVGCTPVTTPPQCTSVRPRDLPLAPTLPRAVSLPSGRPKAHSDSDPVTLDMAGFYRLRSFSTSARGVVNRGDSFRPHKRANSTTSSCGSSESGFCTSGSCADEEESGCFSVKSDTTSCHYTALVLGAPGVGKTALSQQFMTSEDMGHVDTYLEDESERSVPILLDSEECILHLTDLSTTEDFREHDGVDAYVVVYSVADSDSFRWAVERLEAVKRQMTSQQAVILVGNKSDIVRNRVVQESEGKAVAVKFGVKFTEVSAILNHRVDDLLVGIVSQIRLNCARAARNRGADVYYYHGNDGCLHRVAKALLGRLLKRHACFFQTCDNLLVL